MAWTPSARLIEQTLVVRLANESDGVRRPLKAVIDRTGLGDLCAVEVLDLAAQLPGVRLPPSPPRGRYPNWSYDAEVDAMWVLLHDGSTRESLPLLGDASLDPGGGLLSLSFQVPGVSYLATPLRSERWRH